MQINFAGVPPDEIGQFLVQRREEKHLPKRLAECRR
jgi:hypothetical protein